MPQRRQWLPGAADSLRPGLPRRRDFHQARARATYERLCTSAAELFVETGFQATQISDIAGKAGVSVGAFYRYFDDKQHLLIELTHAALEKNRRVQAIYLRKWRDKLTRGQADGRAFLEDAVAFATGQQEIPSELARMFVALSYQDERVAALRRRYDRADRREFARFIAAVTPRDRIPSPIAAARVLDIALEEVIRWSALEGRRTAKETRAALVDMLHRYLFA